MFGSHYYLAERFLNKCWLLFFILIYGLKLFLASLSRFYEDLYYLNFYLPVLEVLLLLLDLNDASNFWCGDLFSYEISIYFDLRELYTFFIRVDYLLFCLTFSNAESSCYLFSKFCTSIFILFLFFAHIFFFNSAFACILLSEPLISLNELLIFLSLDCYYSILSPSKFENAPMFSFSAALFY